MGAQNSGGGINKLVNLQHSMSTVQPSTSPRVGGIPFKGTEGSKKHEPKTPPHKLNQSSVCSKSQQIEIHSHRLKEPESM